MSDKEFRNALYGQPDPWAWRSDMTAGQRPPEATAFKPKYLSDNLPFVLRDAATGLGVSEREGMRLGHGLARALHTFPPTSVGLGFLDLASGVGANLREGRATEAISQLAAAGLFGAYARNFIPGNRDAGIAQILQYAPGKSALPYAMTLAPVTPKPMNALYDYRQMSPPANANSLGLLR